MLAEKSQTKNIKDLLQEDNTLKDELIEKVHTALAKQGKEEVDIEYYLEICEILREFIEPADAWALFKEKADFSKK